MRDVAVGLKPVDNAVLKIFFDGQPANWLESEVDFVVVEGDVLNSQVDLGSCVGHFAFEVIVVATSVLPVLGDEGDENSLYSSTSAG